MSSLHQIYLKEKTSEYFFKLVNPTDGRFIRSDNVYVLMGGKWQWIGPAVFFRDNFNQVNKVSFWDKLYSFLAGPRIFD